MSAEQHPPIARSRVRIGIGAAAVVLFVALGCAVLFSALAPRGASSTVGGGSGVGDDPGFVDAPAASATASGAVIFVHILGAVNRPGLYELRDGARAVDAVAAAGGFVANADQAQLNLARFVADGEQIVVPVVGETPVAASGGAPPGAPGAAGGKVNINTADAATLETLPRVGPAMSARIIAWRETNGRFTAIEDLMSVTGIGEKTFDGFKDLVTL